VHLEMRRPNLRRVSTDYQLGEELSSSPSSYLPLTRGCAHRRGANEIGRPPRGSTAAPLSRYSRIISCFPSYRHQRGLCTARGRTLLWPQPESARREQQAAHSRRKLGEELSSSPSSYLPLTRGTCVAFRQIIKVERRRTKQHRSRDRPTFRSAQSLFPQPYHERLDRVRALLRLREEDPVDAASSPCPFGSRSRLTRSTSVIRYPAGLDSCSRSLARLSSRPSPVSRAS
jgi:hypothetical protein